MRQRSFPFFHSIPQPFKRRDIAAAHPGFQARGCAAYPPLQTHARTRRSLETRFALLLLSCAQSMSSFCLFLFLSKTSKINAASPSTRTGSALILQSPLCSDSLTLVSGSRMLICVQRTAVKLCLALFVRHGPSSG